MLTIRNWRISFHWKQGFHGSLWSVHTVHQHPFDANKTLTGKKCLIVAKAWDAFLWLRKGFLPFLQCECVLSNVTDEEAKVSTLHMIILRCWDTDLWLLFLVSQEWRTMTVLLSDKLHITYSFQSFWTLLYLHLHLLLRDTFMQSEVQNKQMGDHRNFQKENGLDNTLKAIEKS